MASTNVITLSRATRHKSPCMATNQSHKHIIFASQMKACEKQGPFEGVPAIAKSKWKELL